MANSVTSIACFILGGGLILIMGLHVIKRRPTRVHALCLVIVLLAAFAQLLGGQDAILHALGRAPNLTGRTDIWAAVIPAVPNSVIGAGFESFWIGPDVVKFQRAMVGWWHPENLNEAHNGYIEVYLNLGWVGVVLISLILISGYRRAVAAFRLNPSVGSLMLAYVIVSAVYSITEAGFRSPNPMWIFMLLAIVSSTGVTAGFFGERVTRDRAGSRSSFPMASAYRSGSVG
jgi:O-antigen ligase